MSEGKGPSSLFVWIGCDFHFISRHIYKLHFVLLGCDFYFISRLSTKHGPTKSTIEQNSTNSKTVLGSRHEQVVALLKTKQCGDVGSAGLAVKALSRDFGPCISCGCFIISLPILFVNSLPG